MSVNSLYQLRPISWRFTQTVISYCKVSKVTNNYVYRSLSQNTFPKRVLSLSTALAFLWPVNKIKKENKPEPIEQPVNILIESDNLYENGHYEECYDYLQNIKCDDYVEVQWRICRVLYNMSKDPKYEKHLQKTLVYQAFEIISKLLEQAQNNYAVHKWYALLLDAKSSLEGTKARIRQLENIKKHMDLAVKLNPNDATLLHMLGEWCYQITELPWHQRKIAEVLFASPPYSTYENALEYFLKAESVHPRFYSLNLLRIGTCYLKLDREDQAKYYLQLAASYPAKSNDDHLANTEANKLLNKLKK